MGRCVVGLACAFAFALLGVGCGEERVSPPSPEVRALARGALSNGALVLPNALASVKFAVIGESGRGTTPQREVAAQMVRFRETFRFPLVLMLGGNIYEGAAAPADYLAKFQAPYRQLLEDGVRFFAVLGNHDDPRQAWYAPFHMNGQRYFSFVPPEDALTRVTIAVEFFGLDSTNLDRAQLAWLDERLRRSRAGWKIVLMHHPLYTSGRYRLPARAHRVVLEPLLIKHHVDVVFSAHEQIYQRIALQGGIQYFVSGGAGSLRRGDGADAPYIARTYDEDYHFLLVEIEREALHVQAISRTGETIDAATLVRNGGRERAASAGTMAQRR